MDSLQDIMEEVSKALLVAERYNLQIEVVASALKCQKENPDMTPIECINQGLLDWDL